MQNTCGCLYMTCQSMSGIIYSHGSFSTSITTYTDFELHTKLSKDNRVAKKWLAVDVSHGRCTLLVPVKWEKWKEIIRSSTIQAIFHNTSNIPHHIQTLRCQRQYPLSSHKRRSSWNSHIFSTLTHVTTATTTAFTDGSPRNPRRH